MRPPRGRAAMTLAVGLASDSAEDRKSTRLNSSHGYISYAVFCLKKKPNRAVTPRRVLRGPSAASRARSRVVDSDASNDFSRGAAHPRGARIGPAADLQARTGLPH